MRITLLVIMLYINPFLCFSQNGASVDAEIDALQKELQNSSQDTLRATLLLELGDVLGTKGWTTTNQSEFALSYDTYQTAFDLLEDPNTELLFKSFGESSKLQRRYWSVVANLNFNYGHLMGATANYKERQRYYEKANHIANTWNDALNIVYSNTGMAIALFAENKLDSASYRIEKAMSYPPESYNYEEYSTVAYIYGIVKFRLGQYNLAKRYFCEGVKDAINKESKIGLALNYMELSKTYAKLDLRDSSYYYAIESLNLLKVLKEITILNIDLPTGYENLYQHFQHFEQTDSAYKYLQLANTERAVFSEKKINSLALFQQTLLKRQMKIKDLEKEKLEMQTKNEMYFLWAVLIAFLIIGSILYYSYRQKQKANVLLSFQKEEIQSALILLKSTQSQLIQSEKMASLGELTAGIAHEIQNPLNFVNNFSEVNKEMLEELKAERLKPQGERDEQLEDELISDVIDNEEKITHHGKRADAIVKGMLQHSRSSSGIKEPTDINKLADEYLRLAYHGLRAKDKAFNAELVTDFDKSVGLVNVVPQDIGRVILNLITNAFYAVNEKAKADIEGYQPTVTVSSKLTPLLGRAGGGSQVVKIAISDNGNGIPKDIVDKIFQPFFTTKPTGQGTGLGLSMSYDIVTKGHNGELKVNSVLNEGSIFTIIITINE